jgi:hypothetical protein
MSGAQARNDELEAREPGLAARESQREARKSRRETPFVAPRGTLRTARDTQGEASGTQLEIRDARPEACGTHVETRDARPEACGTQVEIRDARLEACGTRGERSVSLGVPRGAQGRRSVSPGVACDALGTAGGILGRSFGTRRKASAVAAEDRACVPVDGDTRRAPRSLGRSGARCSSSLARKASVAAARTAGASSSTRHEDA